MVYFAIDYMIFIFREKSDKRKYICVKNVTRVHIAKSIRIIRERNIVILGRTIGQSCPWRSKKVNERMQKNIYIYKKVSKSYKLYKQSINHTDF